MRIRFVRPTTIGPCRFGIGEITDLEQLRARELIDGGRAAPVDGPIEFATDAVKPEQETADGE
jgi:hypothetical protein